MKPIFLFPSYFKYIGWLLAVPGLVLGYLFEFEHFTFGFLQYGNNSIAKGSSNLTDEYIISLLICGLLLIGFSRSKHENERISFCRSVALYWSVLITSSVIIFTFSVLELGDIYKQTTGNTLRSFDQLGFILLYSFVLYPSVFILLYYFLFFAKRVHFNSSPPLRHRYFLKAGLIALFTFLLLRVVLLFVTTGFSDLTTDINFAIFVCLVFLAAAQERSETKEISHIRNSSMQIATLLASLILFGASWLVYGFSFLDYMCYYPLYLVGAYFVIFRYKWYKLTRSQFIININQSP